MSPQKQFFHCFGCGAHGTVLGFLMDYEHMDFVDAVEELAQRYGLEVPREGGSGRADRFELGRSRGLSGRGLSRTFQLLARHVSLDMTENHRPRTLPTPIGGSRDAADFAAVSPV